MKDNISKKYPAVKVGFVKQLKPGAECSLAFIVGVICQMYMFDKLEFCD